MSLPAQVCEPDKRAQFLRSVHVALDADHVGRISHFRPTRKSVLLVRALIGLEPDRTSLVVAPYGSGKSIAATYTLHTVENKVESRTTLTQIESSFNELDLDLANVVMARHRDGVHGLGVPLVGYQPNLAAGLKTAVLDSMKRLGLGKERRTIVALSDESISDAVKILDVLEEKLARLKFDRYFIVWDEFGRHLENLVSQGRGHELHDVQGLAERVARSSAVPGALGLLLHQSLLQYTSGLPQALRRDWKKIEGRFRVLQFVDDSLEMTHLIAQIVEERPGVKPLQNAKQTEQLAQQVTARSWFADASAAEISNLLSRAAPLEPAALFLLPRLSARVAQNERTLFSFLYSADLGRPVGARELYDYFSDEMRVDTAAGGTYRRWLETESALSKVAGDEVAERVLKTACLMALGLGGERSAVSRADLVLAASGFARKHDDVERKVNQLISRNLLLHRRNADSVSVWHGTDLDLRGRLEAEKSRRRQEFELLRVLRTECPPPVVRPLEHNSKSGVRRFLQGSYVIPSGLTPPPDILHDRRSAPPGVDGEIWYVVTSSAEEYQHAQEVVSASGLPRQIVIAVSDVAPALEDAALEVECLIDLQSDRDLAAMDPLAATELAQLLDDSRINLSRIVDRLTLPGPDGPSWWIDGRWSPVKDSKQLRRALSALMDDVFSESPRIWSEAVVRHSPTRVMVNARKKLNLGILERYGKEGLGIQDNFPDACMFRSVLLHPGLYRAASHERWRFAQPDELDDAGLKGVWRRFEVLLTEPSPRPKNLADFFEEIQSPPIGLRRGLFPILFSAALKAFPSARSISRRREYLPDILPSDVEDICKNPHDYDLVVLTLSDAEVGYLRRILEILGRQQPEAGEDLIRQCFDSLQTWVANLPEGALKSRSIGEDASTLRRLVVGTIDPVDLLFSQLPRRLGDENSPGQATLDALERSLRELSSYSDRQRRAVRQSLVRAYAADVGEDVDSSFAARSWVENLPSGYVDSIKHPPEKGLVVCFRTEYDSEDRFLEAVAAQVTECALSQWDDRTAALFDADLHHLIDHIEVSAISWAGEQECGAYADQLQRLAKRRLAREYWRAVELLGIAGARTLLSELNEGEDLNGDDPRRHRFPGD